MSLTSSRIPTVARAVIYPQSAEKLIKSVRIMSYMNVRYIIAGRMSNLLFKDGLYDGVIIKTDKIDRYTLADDIMSLSCGAMLYRPISEAARRDLGGMEGLCSIPGTVGGMIRQNAGAYGYEIADRLLEAWCFDPEADSFSRISHDEMNFSYRQSILSKKRMIILNAIFKMIPKSRERIFEEIAEYKEKRRASQPYEHPSLGSIFKRHCGVSAGYYIDRAGLKGTSVGGAAISEKHAGFIVNKGGATADDFLSLIELVKTRVYDLFGIELEEEIEII